MWMEFDARALTMPGRCSSALKYHLVVKFFLTNIWYNSSTMPQHSPQSQQPDKFSAIWVSHSSLSDFLACPRAYYIANLYKNPRTGRKITLMKPPLALGQAVHALLDSLSHVPTEDRFKTPLEPKLDSLWEAISGKKGGFSSVSEEAKYRDRAYEMLKRIQDHPGPLARKALKMKEDLPYFWLSEADNIILCGKIDWIEYFEETDSVHIIDFKTGKREEKADSLQLPIYYLLAKNCQKRPVDRMSYWYIDRDDEPKAIPLPDEQDSLDRLMKAAQRIKLARQLDHFKCSVDSKEGCMHCAPYEAVLKGKAEFVGVGEYNKEVYILSDEAVAL